MNILIVDDQPGVRYLLDIVAGEAGHRVCTAENGLEAIDAVRSFNPDLVFYGCQDAVDGRIRSPWYY